MGQPISFLPVRKTSATEFRAGVPFSCTCKTSAAVQQGKVTGQSRNRIRILHDRTGRIATQRNGCILRPDRSIDRSIPTKSGRWLPIHRSTKSRRLRLHCATARKSRLWPAKCVASARQLAVKETQLIRLQVKCIFSHPSQTTCNFCTKYSFQCVVNTERKRRGPRPKVLAIHQHSSDCRN